MSYRYIFLSMRDDDVIEEISLFGVYFNRMLNAPGQFSASFNMDQSGKLNSDLVAATTPGRTWLVAERDGVPVYWGIIWSRTYQSQAKIMELYGWGFEAYPQRRVVGNFTRTAMPNTQVFSDLWNDMQIPLGSNLNINVPGVANGPNKDVAILATDYHYYSDIMDSIANASDGFDWTIDISKGSDNTYNKTLRIGYPTMGTDTTTLTLATFEYPGAITNYYSTDSMAESGTDVYLLGSGEGANMPVSIIEQTQMLALEGWPRWDFVSSHKDVTSQAQINGLAQQEAVIRKPPAPTYKVTVKGNLEPVFGSYGLGDACQLIITDARYPSSDGSTPGLSVTSRIIGWELRPPEVGQVEEVIILLPGDTVNG